MIRKQRQEVKTVNQKLNRSDWNPVPIGEKAKRTRWQPDTARGRVLESSSGRRSRARGKRKS